MIKTEHTYVNYITEFSKGVIGQNNYYVFLYSTSEDGHIAERDFRAAFKKTQSECAMPKNAEDLTVDFLRNAPGFGTGFRDGGKVLLVRTNQEPEADGLVIKHLGKPTFRMTL